MNEIIILLITYIAVIICLIISDFTLILKELEVLKSVKIGYLKIVFNNNRNYALINKTYNILKYYNNYQLPTLTSDT